MNFEEIISNLERQYYQDEMMPRNCLRVIAVKLRAAEELAAYCRGFDGATWSTKVLELTREYDKAGDEII